MSRHRHARVAQAVRIGRTYTGGCSCLWYFREAKSLSPGRNGHIHLHDASTVLHKLCGSVCVSRCTVSRLSKGRGMALLLSPRRSSAIAKKRDAALLARALQIPISRWISQARVVSRSCGAISAVKGRLQVCVGVQSGLSPNKLGRRGGVTEPAGGRV